MELTPEQRTALETHAKCRERYRLGGEGGEGGERAAAAPPLRASARPALTPTQTGVTNTDATTGTTGEVGGGAVGGGAVGGGAAGSAAARGSASADGSFLNTKKRPQLLFMTEQIRAVLQAH